MIADVNDEKFDELFITPPSTLAINFNDIYHRCQNVVQAEEYMSSVRLSEATNTSLESEAQPLFENKRLLRSFYYVSTVTFVGDRGYAVGSRCVLVRSNMSHQGRDSVSSLAIGISGLS
ncbi:hypothetical protein BDF21DRAFT_464837 [Thamnidium elegans]|uniref:Uncharacterized protein n=1 Tax=Thamnidium elegans TaxID=101142 RepID=A0A8H7SUN0_9FUNG|nr:hypothetical protein INT48_003125 [Thamnidium elegans]KAI8075644.1 hypothetical protein BDF21DRAFT_464837 [Thamnidium elegans]